MRATLGIRAIPQPAVLGVDFLLNGGFDSDTIWTKGAGWTISGGVASHSSGAALLTQPWQLVVGAVYQIIWTLVTRTAGTCSVGLISGTNVLGTARTAPGTYTDTLTALSGNATAAVVPSSPFVGTVDNVSMTRIS